MFRNTCALPKIQKEYYYMQVLGLMRYMGHNDELVRTLLLRRNFRNVVCYFYGVLQPKCTQLVNIINGIQTKLHVDRFFLRFVMVCDRVAVTYERSIPRNPARLFIKRV